MSDLAASGGYYIAPGDAIVAQPGTLTGSIGVYTGKFVTGGTLREAGREHRERAATASSPRWPRPIAVHPGRAEQVLESMQATYDHSSSARPRRGRCRPRRSIRWPGPGVDRPSRPREVGLVDQLGGLYTAIALAKQRAQIPAEEEVELVVYPRQRSFYEVLSDRSSRRSGRVRSAQPAPRRSFPCSARAIADLLAGLLAPSRLFRAGELLAHMPYVFIR